MGGMNSKIGTLRWVGAVIGIALAMLTLLWRLLHQRL